MDFQPTRSDGLCWSGAEARQCGVGAVELNGMDEVGKMVVHANSAVRHVHHTVMGTHETK
jgi:hypothetical protein